MKRVSKEWLSRQRQQIYRRLEELREYYNGAVKPSLLFGGSPMEVYRQCGKENCRCARGGELRHGPYRVIAVRNGDSVRQVTLKQDEGHFYEMAKSYQEQRRNRGRIIEIQDELLKQFDELIERRTTCKKQ